MDREMWREKQMGRETERKMRKEIWREAAREMDEKQREKEVEREGKRAMGERDNLSTPYFLRGHVNMKQIMLQKQQKHS